MTDELIEKMARAIEQATIERQGQGLHVVTGYNDSVVFATAALDALRETHHLVPKDSEPVAYDVRGPRGGKSLSRQSTDQLNGWTETPLYAIPEKRHDV